MGNRRCYLASAITSAGFVSFFGDVLKDAERVYIIKGGPGCGKSTFMKRIGEDLLQAGMDVDFIYCSSDSDSLDGVVIRDINAAIVDGTAPHVIDPKYPGAVEWILNFEEYWDIDYLRRNKADVKYYVDEIGKQYEILYSHMDNAKKIHDRWESEYRKGMNFEMANKMALDLIKDVIKDEQKIKVKGREVHRFSGAMTPQGQVCFYDILTKNIKNRYVLKGRPGSGKSTLAKKIAKAAMDKGYDIEFYHCSFDPNSIDMIIIPELSFAILDGTAPHVFDPGEGDKLIDMFECIDTNIVHETEPPITAIQIEYANEINKAKEVFRRIKSYHDNLEKIYVAATDFNNIDALRIRITRALKEMKEERENKQ